MSAINSRQKGAAGEREAAAYLSQLFNLPVHRGRQYRGGPESPDVAGLPGLTVEVKRRERLHLEAALQQATQDAKPTDVPLVLHRADRDRWKFILYADDLIRFVDACNLLIDLGRRTGPTPESPSLNNHQPKEQP